VAESSSLALAARHQSWPGSRHQLNASQSRSAARRLREITDLGIGRQTDWSLQGTPIVAPSLPIDMTPRARRIVQAALYEVGAIAFVGPVLGFAFEKPASSTFLLALVLSAIALCWNYVFNAAFERWESKQAVKGRSLARRLAHGTGFEGGLTFILVPVMALWLDTSFLAAFMATLGLLGFFFLYAIAYTWVFDKVFGLPKSALGPQ
jgi:uncharacterized membrane protein